MRKLDSQRLAILIDADNVEIHARTTYRRLIDYKALYDSMNGREVVRAIYFKPKSCDDGFRSFLEHVLGFEVQLPAKNVDTWLTIAAVGIADKVDAVALVGGDGDYAPLAWYLRSRGCKVEVWSWPSATATALREAADEFRPLNVSMLMPSRPKTAPVASTAVTGDSVSLCP